MRATVSPRFTFYPICGSLVLGGEIVKIDSFTIYGGSLDDPSSFAAPAGQAQPFSD